jgi:hydroxypyruvate reductase
VKGGGLAAAYAPATVLSLILSDVSGDDLDAIASGPTVPDPTTFSEALGIAKRYGILDALPQSVADRLLRGAAGEIPDTPKAGDPVFARARTILLGSNRLALMASRARAEALGYSTLALTSRLSGEAREVALMYLAVGKDIAASGFPLARPACFLAGGETTVSLRGSGLGGRNQEMALAFLDAMERFPKDAEDLVFLAASTDGNDGPTDAAGAFASAEILARGAAAGIKAADYLADNDSWHFFDRIGGLLRTGPTNTNVCDIQVLLVP